MLQLMPYHHTKYVTEITRLCLCESFSLPILTYGCEGTCLSDGDIKKLNVCWNNAFRKISNECLGVSQTNTVLLWST